MIWPLADHWGKLLILGAERENLGKLGRQLAGDEVESRPSTNIMNKYEQITFMATVNKYTQYTTSFVTWTQLWRATSGCSHFPIFNYILLHEHTRTYFSQITSIVQISYLFYVFDPIVHWVISMCSWLQDDYQAKNLHVKIFQECASTFQVFFIKISEWAKSLPLLHIGTLLQTCMFKSTCFNQNTNWGPGWAFQTRNHFPFLSLRPCRPLGPNNNHSQNLDLEPPNNNGQWTRFN